MVDLDFEPNRYRIINSSEVMEKMTAKVMKVKAIIGDDWTNAIVRNLLNKHRWDTEKFLEDFYINDSSLQECETRMVGDVKKENKDPAKSKKKKKKSNENEACSSTRITRSQARKREYQFEFKELTSEPPRKIRISAGLSEQNSFSEGSQLSNKSSNDVITCLICLDEITVKVELTVNIIFFKFH